MESSDTKGYQNIAEGKILSLNNTDTIKTIDGEKLPNDEGTLGSNWVFKKKYDTDGKLDK